MFGCLNRSISLSCGIGGTESFWSCRVERAIAFGEHMRTFFKRARGWRGGGRGLISSASSLYTRTKGRQDGRLRKHGALEAWVEACTVVSTATLVEFRGYVLIKRYQQESTGEIGDLVTSANIPRSSQAEALISKVATRCINVNTLNNGLSH